MMTSPAMHIVFGDNLSNAEGTINPKPIAAIT
jgi:hypothetical protein